MRNWNPAGYVVSNSASSASRLPMRNWNLNSEPQPDPDGLDASRLPMRNWNPTSNHRNWRERSQASRLPMRNWNGERLSMMSWKRSSFQTTYEELKRREVMKTKCDEHASRLPMRNWNTTLASGENLTEFASRLPMRNWNIRVSASCQPSQVALPDYLWGIETGERRDKDICEWWASRLPMRNWNVSATAFAKKNGMLPDYIWGIETIRPYVSPNPFPLPDTYEELKPEL